MQVKNDIQATSKHNGDDADINEDTTNDYGTFDQANVQINQTEDQDCTLNASQQNIQFFKSTLPFQNLCL